MKLPANLTKRRLVAALACFLVGILWVFALRFVFVAKNEVHYHANFAVYINGVREMFDNFSFYEEVQLCGGDELNNPRTRAHMHDRVNHVAHVHDNAATWGHFFANLGYTLGPNLIATDKGIFKDGDNGSKLTVWLNGKELIGAYNAHIKSEDVLLVSYGAGDQTELQAEYDLITHDAAEYNKRNDPSKCTGGKPLTLSERFEKTLKFWE